MPSVDILTHQSHIYKVGQHNLANITSALISLTIVKLQPSPAHVKVGQIKDWHSMEVGGGVRVTFLITQIPMGVALINN